MKKQVWFGLFIGAWVISSVGQGFRSYPLDGNSFVYGRMLYRQDLREVDAAVYPKWNPGEGACPLHPTNVYASIEAVTTNLLLNGTIESDTLHLALFEWEGLWFYDAQFNIIPSEAAPDYWARRANLIVGIDGSVPNLNRKPVGDEYPNKDVRQGTELPAGMQRKFGQGFRRVSEKDDQQTTLSPEEKAKKREEVRENLREYQMAVIRAGMPPLPIPLTAEMDDTLVKEGILPPAETNKSSAAAVGSTNVTSMSD